MIRASTLLAGLLLAQIALAGNRPPQPASNEALLRELESRYSQAMDAARRGDVDGYWQFRTDASRSRPPALDAARIRLLADLLPPLSAMEFVRLDATPKTARALYRWRKSDVAQYSVLVYRVERGEWKLDDVSVRRNALGTAGASQPRLVPIVPAPAASTLSAAALPRAAARLADDAAPGHEAALPAESRAMLRAWESAQPDPSRRLDAPRL
jgi:hypothetical protein